MADSCWTNVTNYIKYEAEILSERLADVAQEERVKEILKIIVTQRENETLEQAKQDRKRDRMFQRHGYRVLRFTGQEIYQDPFRCAHEEAGVAKHGSL